MKPKKKNKVKLPTTQQIKKYEALSLQLDASKPNGNARLTGIKIEKGLF